MEAHFELWMWQSGRSCERTCASEPTLRLTADAMVSGLWSPLAFGETNAHSQGSEALSLKGAMSVATRETRDAVRN